MLTKIIAKVLAVLMLADAASAQPISREEYAKQLDAKRKQVKTITRDVDPKAWAEANADLGFDLYLFNTAEHVTEAVGAYEAALEVYSREVTPAEWAKTQERLGIAQLRLASIKGMAMTLIGLGGGPGRGAENDFPDPTPNLSDALRAFDAAGEVYTQAAYPDNWARLQLLKGQTASMLAMLVLDDKAGVNAHRGLAMAAFLDVLQFVDAKADPLTRGFAHQGIVSLNERGFVDDTDRIRLALDHAKLARADFIAAGEAQLADSLDRTISRLEYDLEGAKNYVPSDFDSVFGTRRN